MLRAFLADHNVFCPIHWPLPHVPDQPLFNAEHALEKSIVTLPVDQRMNDTHIERLGQLLGDFFGEQL
jgi:hypothetical protein